MKAARWVCPVPQKIGHVVRVWRPGKPLLPIADVVAERAWKGEGVRVFRFPDGTWALVSIGQRADDVLMRHCGDALFATYVRGALWSQIVADMKWAGRTST
ncbi:hypothetical protein [Rhodanobacter sp. BL-MT-08]